MGAGFRCFIVDDDDSLHRIPTARFNRLLNGEAGESLPEYSGKQKRCALVILEVDGRTPLHIDHIDYVILYFDAQGCLDKSELRRAAHLAVQSMPPLFADEQPGTVIDARSHFYRRRYENEFRWEPTPEIEFAIRKAIFRDSPF